MPQFTAPRPSHLNLRKPRNPLVAHALMRQAGKHGQQKLGSSQRQATRRDLQKQSQELMLPDRSA